MPATMSILGLYNFNPTIFDDFALPTDINTDKDVLINNLLMECAEFEILYTDPDFMKFAIKQWSEMMLTIWEKQLATTKFTYNPIENYNRYEFYKDITDRTDKTTFNSTHKTDYDITDTLTNGKTETSAQNSFENAGFVDAARVTNSGKDENRKAGYDSLKRSGSDTLDIDNTFTHDAHINGNIGVTTTQQMIEQERQVILFNMFQIIIDDFKNRFCLLIY